MAETIRLDIPALTGNVSGGLDTPTREALTQLARALDRRCDAVGECGCRCTLRADHPGEIHEEYRYGSTLRFRLTGPSFGREQ